METKLNLCSVAQIPRKLTSQAMKKSRKIDYVHNQKNLVHCTVSPKIFKNKKKIANGNKISCTNTKKID